MWQNKLSLLKALMLLLGVLAFSACVEDRYSDPGYGYGYGQSYSYPVYEPYPVYRDRPVYVEREPSYHFWNHAREEHQEHEEHEHQGHRGHDRD